LADPEYTYSAKDLEKLRTNLAVPILKGDDLLGVLVIYHLEEVRPFTDKQIALVETFADQAAIAIDNVRLLDALRHRTYELSESLEQQTATADVLKLISRSTFDLESVLNTLVESAARLCEADIATIAREKDEYYHVVAGYGFPPGFRDYVEAVPMERGRGSVFGRDLLECKPVQVVDVLADPEYAMREIQKSWLSYGARCATPARGRPDWSIERDPHNCKSFHRQADRIGHNLRRSGLDRDRERAPIR
jgi:two-component system, NtrC family, sensor kinase